MLWVDDREKDGDRPLFDKIESAHPGLAESVRLAHGDFALLNGDGELVGVERKTIGDLLRVIADKRFVSEQLLPFSEYYAVRYFLVEGAFKPGPEGQLLMRRGAGWEQPTWGRRGGWSYAEVARWLISVCDSGGLQYQRTVTVGETIQWLREMSVEWQKPRVDRRATSGIYHTPLPGGLAAPSEARKFASLLPGIGVGRSAAVADFFGGSPEAMFLADEKTWAEVPGIGKGTAKRIKAWMKGR